MIRYGPNERRQTQVARAGVVRSVVEKCESGGVESVLLEGWRPPSYRLAPPEDAWLCDCDVIAM
jgi:hypothetical protein